MKRLEDMTEPELRTFMNAAAKAVEKSGVDQGVDRLLFILLVFNDPAVAQYVANCRREDCVKALKEAYERLAGREDVPRVAFPDKPALSPVPVTDGRIGSQWEEFASRVLPAGASVEQFLEMRRAFYAGALAVLFEMRKIGEDDAIDEDAGADILDGMEKECQAFQRAIQRGEA